jgi:hypothetical protein
MNPTLTPLHLALGAPAGLLTWEHIEQLVEIGVGETAQLDWKRVLPEHDEFAKDVAAMANAEGGVILYGIAEQKRQGLAVASKYFPVDLSEGRYSSMRNSLTSRVRPVVTDLHFHPIPKDGGSEGVLMVVIGRSANAPHVVGNDTQFTAPVRAGASTRYMAEYELAQTYRRRFENDTSLRAALADMEHQLLAGLDRSQPWITTVARLEFTSVSRAPIGRRDVAGLMHAAHAAAADLGNGQRQSTYLDYVRENDHSPRIGLRRWILESYLKAEPDAVPDRMRVELHHDGSITIATNIRSHAMLSADDERRTIGEDFINVHARDSVGLITALAAAGAASTTYVARTNLQVPTHLDRGLQVWGPHISQAGYERDSLVLPGSRSVKEFVPTELTIDVGDQHSALDAAKQLANDVLAQFSISRRLGFAGDEP